MLTPRVLAVVRGAAVIVGGFVLFAVVLHRPVTAYLGAGVLLAAVWSVVQLVRTWRRPEAGAQR